MAPSQSVSAKEARPKRTVQLSAMPHSAMGSRQDSAAISEGIARDRHVDFDGNQIGVFGRRGSRPFSLQEMRKLFLDDSGKPWYVTDQVEQKVSRQ